MSFIVLGVIGFIIIHLFDVVALKGMRWMKPVVWTTGCILLGYAATMVCLSPDRFNLPAWASITGWLMLPGALTLLIYALFGNLPFRKTYLEKGVGSELIKNGLYAIVRHPGVYGFGLLLLSLVLLSASKLMLLAGLVWLGMDIILVVLQDLIFFGRMFPGYTTYRHETPMIIPTWQSLSRYATDFTLKSLDMRRNVTMSKVADLFAQGKNEEIWQRCCGFLDLSIADFMRIQKRLLMEQIGLLEKCELGQGIMDGAKPESVEEFRDCVPLTTYADYAPYLLKRRADVLPKKPLLWQYTSGKSGEYDYLWAPVTARAFDEIEPLVFAVIILAAATKRGEVNFHKNDRLLYSMAPPPYATGTIMRALPNELVRVLPPVIEAERIPFEERMKKGFDMALSEGLDIAVCMSSIAVAIGERFSRQGQETTSIKAWLKKDPRTLARLARGMLKAKLNRRPLMPKDLWNLKGLITFGIDGDVFREKIKDIWGCYPLDFHGCTEAPIIAMQAWDHSGMTFVPHLNFFEFIPEKDSLRSREDISFKPRTLLMNELVPGNYELVITSLQGGPFIRYRLGHLVKILSQRNDNLNIDIPQMSFVARIDDQIDIAGFTRLSEKIIWRALENSGLEYVDWVARKEVHEKPVLHLYVETKGESRKMPLIRIAELIHEELKLLDTPYAELESFTGIRPLMVSILPEGAFKTYELRQRAAGADIAHLKPSHIEPSTETIEFLTRTSISVRVHGEEIIEKRP